MSRSWHSFFCHSFKDAGSHFLRLGTKAALQEWGAMSELRLLVVG